jgi:signal transduction histidine kinase
MQLEAVDCHLEGDDTGRAREVLQQAMARARSTHHEARRAIQALRASVLEELDLVEALDREVEQFRASSGVPCRFEADADGLEIEPEKAQHILRITQEALSNAARHGRAGRVKVSLEEDGTTIRLRVEDDGAGFDESSPSEGFGLAGMRERAARINADLRIQSEIGRGTTIELEIGDGSS